ncbi:SusC/RagA family TonB-linked outer membrane protein [Parapedobacter koreensis]|nr:TonB-dependent receptor [Parapedobacter koreensis]
MQSFAQGQTANGTVRDATTNEPLPGVAVNVVGSSTSTSTNEQGNFTLQNIPAGATLEFSSVGYTAQRVSAATNMMILLDVEQSELDEVVVVGYGTVKKSDLTGAVGSVSNQTLTKGGQFNALAGMQGAVSGVNIVRSNSKPGGGYSIEVRGLSSISSTNEPLVVIDGVPGANLDKINPDDIEKVDILKDASATAIYGSRGANGVVIVTTKRGVDGKPSVSYQGYVGFRQYMNLPDMMSGNEYVQLARETRRATNNNEYISDETIFSDPSELLAVQQNNYFDWVSAVSNTAMQTNHTISATGGTEDTKYSLSAGYYNEGGMLYPQGYDRYNLRANLDLTANRFLNFGGSLYLTYDDRETGNSDLMQDAIRMRPTQHPNSLVDGTELFRYPSNGLFNPLVTQQNEFNNTKATNILANAYVSLKPIEGLELRSSFSPYIVNTQVGQYRGVYTKALQGTAAGATNSLRKYTDLNWVFDNIANYKWESGVHRLDITGVFSLQQNQYENIQAASRDLSFNSLWYNLQGGEMTGLSSAYTRVNLMSYLLRANYTFNDKYMLTASARYDGSSKLASGNKWALFPSAAVAWRLKQEAFLTDVDWLSDLKLRLSYGRTGNDSVSPYSTSGTISGPRYYVFGEDVIGNAPNNLRNDALTWEKTAEYNLGIDFGLFRSRISGSVELYNRLTTDLIMSRIVPTHLGYGSITDNVGSVRNKGTEVMLNTVNVVTDNFRWTSVISVAYNHNAIVDLAAKEDMGRYSPQLEGMMGDYANRWFIGQPIRTNWNLMTIGVWQLGEEEEAARYGQRPGQFRVRDFDGDGAIHNDRDRAIDGKRQADWNGGFTNTFEYKDFDLAVHTYWRTGARERNQFYVSYALENNNMNFNNLRKDYWTPENPSNTMGQPSNMGPYRDQNSTVSTVSHVVQSTDFLKIAYATLGYTFKSSLAEQIKASRIRLYATVQNPFIFTSWSGFDPEQPSASIGGTDLMTRSVLFGLNVSF